MFALLANLTRTWRLAILLAATMISSLPAAAQATESPISPVAEDKADLVVIYKDQRLLQLKRQGQIVRSFDIALGVQPEGHKRMEGDGRTPEGVYTLDWRNSNSQFYRSIHVSYPREQDREPALRWGASPGGLIMIHGLPNGRGASDVDHPKNDWTNGCIAVTNDEMDQIWSMVDDGTMIIIFP